MPRGWHIAKSRSKAGGTGDVKKMARLAAMED
jgi:hypothetical protein